MRFIFVDCFKITRVSNAVAAGTSDINSSSVDMQGYDAVEFVVLFGAIVATAVTSVKAQQSSDWGGPDLNDAQRDYAASDVRYLHRMKEELDRRLAREGRTEMAQACFDFLPMRAQLDLMGWPDTDIFAHS